MAKNKIAELVDHEIQWNEHVCPKAGYGIQRRGKLIEVKGRNLYVDMNGTFEWKWLPFMHDLKKVEST